MEMIIDFPGGAKVDAHFGDFTVKTDQPPIGGGEGSAPPHLRSSCLRSAPAPAFMYWAFADNAIYPPKASASSSGCTAIASTGMIGKDRSGDPNASRFPREVSAFPDPFCGAMCGEETPRKSTGV